LQESRQQSRVGAVIRQLIQTSAIAALVLGALLVAPVSRADSPADTPDSILVVKSERKLYLLSGDSIIRTINITLGLVPEGPKQREGDYRTPEGRYFIEAKNPNSDYFLSLKVSYPNARDRALARELGVDPGGQIMIHGLPNEPKQAERMYDDWDWTDGCIAVSNSDMVDLWRLISVATPIEIRP
jgi:murein L,D-transpeptidase YafK